MKHKSGFEWKDVQLEGSDIRTWGVPQGVHPGTSPFSDLHKQSGFTDSAADKSEEVCPWHQAGQVQQDDSDTSSCKTAWRSYLIGTQAGAWPSTSISVWWCTSAHETSNTSTTWRERRRYDTPSERRITERRITERRITERRITERRISERQITERRKLPNVEYYPTSNMLFFFILF